MTDIDIRGCRTAEELVAVVDLCDRAFDNFPREYFERHKLKDPTLSVHHTRIGLKDGHLVTSVQVFPRTCWAEGRQVRFGGIGDVATDPAQRKHGYAGLMMADAIAVMSAEGYEFSMLTTTINSYYEKFGYRTIPRDVAVIASTPPRTVPEVRRFDRARDLAVVQDLYTAYNRDSIGPVVRDDVYWRGQFDFCGEDPEKFLVYETGGRLTGYIRANVEKGFLQVLEFAAAESIPEVFDTLLHAVAERSPGLPCKIFLSAREKQRLEIRPIHTMQVDTDLMVRVMDEKARHLVESVIMRPHAIMYWLSDFF